MIRGRAARSASPGIRQARSRSSSAIRTSRSMRNHDENGNMIDDEPISSFQNSLDTIPSDEWQARTLAFETLIESINTNANTFSSGSGIIPWYKSSITLRRLTIPISQLLLDPRSKVVKHITFHFVEMVTKINATNPPDTDVCKHLMKDLLPTVINLHGQTVNVIRVHTFEMMQGVIPICRFKSGLPVLLERLKKDKSRDVREACVRYINTILQHWTMKDQDLLAQNKEPYLTEGICMHIGNGIARALTDPAQEVRAEARTAFDLFRCKYPELWNKVVQKKDGVFSKDAKLKKSVLASANSDQGLYNSLPPSFDKEYDDHSFNSYGSKSSINSFTSGTSLSRGGGVGRGGSNNPQRSGSRPRASTSRPRGTNDTVSPGPPKRMPNNNAKSTARPPSRTRSGENPPKNTVVSDRRGVTKSSLPQDSHQNKTKPIITTIETNLEVNPISPLETKTPTMRLSERLKSPAKSNTPKNIDNNENVVVGTQILRAHKAYIDDLMENLRREMDIVRDFEALLISSQNPVPQSDTQTLTEDHVLTYFENVYGMLETATLNASNLRKVLHDVSREDVG